MFTYGQSDGRPRASPAAVGRFTRSCFFVDGQVGVEPLERSDPRRVGSRVTLSGRLGAGGMGRVYYGVTDDYEQVAVKVIRRNLVEVEEIRQRFFREVEALRTVQGAHVASLVDAADESDEWPWLAMEFIRGLTIKEFVAGLRPLGQVQTATLGVLLADALQDIHNAGLLHRDLKPANVVLGRDGPTIIDFGLVTFVAGPTDLTNSQAMLGTLACMPPEQAVSPRAITTAADVYALGATLMFAVSGHYPYRADSDAHLLGKILDPSLAPETEGVPPELVGPLVTMLASQVADRPTVAQARALLAELAGPLPQAVEALTTATYVERDTDPPELTPPPRPSRPDLSRIAPPGSLLAGLADRLRHHYAATARF